MVMCCFVIVQCCRLCLYSLVQLLLASLPITPPGTGLVVTTFTSRCDWGLVRLVTGLVVVVLLLVMVVVLVVLVMPVVVVMLLVVVVAVVVLVVVRVVILVVELVLVVVFARDGSWRWCS